MKERPIARIGDSILYQKSSCKKIIHFSLNSNLNSLLASQNFPNATDAASMRSKYYIPDEHTKKTKKSAGKTALRLSGA